MYWIQLPSNFLYFIIIKLPRFGFLRFAANNRQPASGIRHFLGQHFWIGCIHISENRRIGESMTERNCGYELNLTSNRKFQMCTSSVIFLCQVFRGNSNSNTVVKHALIPAIRTTYVRFYPRSWRGHISMRVEVYGQVYGEYFVYKQWRNKYVR